MIELKPDNGWIAFDSDGVRYPWYVSGVLDILDKMDLNGKMVFEYGMGYSTLWFQSRGAYVHGIESNEEWAEFTRANCTHDETKYINSIHYQSRLGPILYDIVCIDGIYRDKCTPLAYSHLQKGGIIIIDNWMQPSVEPNEWFRTCDLLATKKLKFEVFRQEGHPDWSTLIIYT